MGSGLVSATITSDSSSVSGFAASGVSGARMSKTDSLLISTTSGSPDSSPQTPSASHKTRRSGGFMLRLGQNTKRRLLRGIFVSLLCFAVARMSSVTVRIRSLFSGGSWPINDLRALRRDWEGGRMELKLGIASVESDGGLRIAWTFLGPEGSEGPTGPFTRGLLSFSLRLLS
jgi:hypothetical protein